MTSFIAATPWQQLLKAIVQGNLRQRNCDKKRENARNRGYSEIRQWRNTGLREKMGDRISETFAKEKWQNLNQYELRKD